LSEEFGINFKFIDVRFELKNNEKDLLF
jgi:hypothetical protein